MAKTTPADRLARRGQPSLVVPLAVSFLAVLIILAVLLAATGAEAAPVSIQALDL